MSPNQLGVLCALAGGVIAGIGLVFWLKDSLSRRKRLR